MKNIMKFAATSVAMLIFAAAAAIAQPTPPTPDSGTPSFGNNSNAIVYPAWVTAVQQPAGIKSIFAPTGGVAGVNLGSVTADPSVLVNGDMWYNSTSNVFKMYQGGAIAIIATGGSGSFITLAVSSTSALTGTVTVGGGGTSGANVLFSGTTGSAPAGGIHLDAGAGLFVNGISATTYDTTLSNPTNGNWLRNPHATQNAEIVGNAIMDAGFTVAGTSTFNGIVNGIGAASGNGAYINQWAGTWTASTNGDLFLGADYIDPSIATAGKTGLNVNTVFINTPAVTGGGSITSGWQLNIAAPAAGQSGAINVASGISQFGGEIQMTGSVAGTTTNGTAQFGAITANGAEVCGKGSATDVVLLNGTGAIAAEVPTGSTTFQTAGGRIHNITIHTSNYTVLATDDIVIQNGTVTTTLPLSPVPGTMYHFAGSVNSTIAAGAGQTINYNGVPGNTTIALSASHGLTLVAETTTLWVDVTH